MPCLHKTNCHQISLVAFSYLHCSQGLPACLSKSALPPNTLSNSLSHAAREEFLAAIHAQGRSCLHPVIYVFWRCHKELAQFQIFFMLRILSQEATFAELVLCSSKPKRLFCTLASWKTCAEVQLFLLTGKHICAGFVGVKKYDLLLTQ